MNTKFYMVWSPQGSAPTKKHEYFDEAEAEAKRLANMNKDQQFYVLMAMSRIEFQSVVITPLVG